MVYDYTPHGVCSQHIHLEVEDGVIRSVEFLGGCNGNLKGISSLVRGMRPEEAVERLKGIHCGEKPTSCPDQLSRALEEMLKNTKQ